MSEQVTFISSFSEWFGTHGVVIIITIILAIFLFRFSRRPIERIVRAIIPPDTFPNPEAEKQREDTIIEIISSIFKVAIWIVLVMVILMEFGIPVGPLLTGAGIVGIALGFGTQYIVRDVATGVFLVIENQFRIGDVICINNLCGTVEQMTLRVTKLRDYDGTAHYIPNGEIKTVSNQSKDFSKINFLMEVSSSTDIDKLEAVVNEVGEAMSQDEKFGPMIMIEPKFVRVEDFKSSGISFRIAGKVQPKKQWEVAGEMKRRLKVAFEKNKITHYEK